MPECYLCVLKYYLPEKFLDLEIKILSMQLNLKQKPRAQI